MKATLTVSGRPQRLLSVDFNHEGEMVAIVYADPSLIDPSARTISINVGAPEVSLILDGLDINQKSNAGVK